ncbi:FAD/NAD(P)-dependent oxidoreductase [Streptomyces albireticuli]|uniref:FAD/NAD(P)-dependent oxidoreductase n=1 Tax=Streptomyces albireticuli TaxID=1940 RepID=UPI00117E5854|nr:NAD(P)/FAD-dependent oxidoreductase [Streptomyces albireticuli]MCD9141425.1 NAD(P)/FAD-dependent oxidoreductase [Streptomyces albireticuli]MCD9160614.1 NAD(P)/FAD-dependent oxidoreductase [Streptomyces albireticuli]MCD9195830.1 NAD(P)/FAD-dependent oxidoreductase [Streptomyces albireticuli]
MPGSPSEPYDLAVIGAGPAGLAGAATAARLGLSVAVLDAAAQAGGQYFRHPAPGLGAARPEALHHDWAAFTELRRRFEASGAAHLAGHHVWAVMRRDEGLWSVHALVGEDGGEGAGHGGGTAFGRGGGLADGGRGGAGADGATAPGAGGGGMPRGGGRGAGGARGHDGAGAGVGPVTRDGRGAGARADAVSGREGPASAGAGDERTVRLHARAVLFATGASERHLPFPGWTLPGVVGAGGAQAMLKSGLVLPGRRIVVAGSGPLLLAVASTLAAAGARVPAVAEAAGYVGYARSPRTLAANPHKLLEAAVHGTALLRHRVPLHTRSAVTEAHGTDRVEAVTVSRLDRDWRPVPGTGRRIACDALAVGHGLAPQTELATGLGCATRRVPDGTHALVLDGLQETSVPGLWAAGEAGGTGGWELARVEGELAGIAVAARLRALPALTRGRRVRDLARRRDRTRAFADAMATTHAPGHGWTAWLDDDTDVCRCEEVTAGSVREAVTGLGARDARTVKLLTRAGMGWCQGRMCGAAVACLAASGTARGTVPPSAERRPLAVPVPLGSLAAGPEEPGDA